MAYATRYGRAGLGEVLELGASHLSSYLEAVGKLVRAENEAGSHGLGER